MSARAFWYPSPHSIQYTDIGIALSDLQELEQRDEYVEDAASGRRLSLQFWGNRAVDIKCEMIASRSVAGELETLQNHIRSRRIVAIAEEENAVLAGLGTSSLPMPGNTSVSFVSQFNAFGNPTVADGDRFIITGGPSSYLREEVTAISWDGHSLSLSSPIMYDYSDEPYIFVRDKRFHPFLRLRSAGKPMVYHDRRVTWTLDLPMEEVPTAPADGGGGAFGGDVAGAAETTPIGQFLLGNGDLTFWDL